MSKKGAKNTHGNAQTRGLAARTSAPQRETEAFQPQMRDAMLASLRRFPFEPSGVLGFDNIITRSNALREVEDLRYGKPHTRSLVERQYKCTDGTPAGYGRRFVPVQNRVYGLHESLRLQFHQPVKTVVCRRRQTRRRILFALSPLHGKRGSGLGRRRAKWTRSSYIQCRGVK